MEKIQIRQMETADWEAVRSIYQEGLETRNATFETSPGSWEKWDSSHLANPRLAALIKGEVVGWAALSPVSNRCVYGGVAEVSVYVASRAQGNGVGYQLLKRLTDVSEMENIWTLQAGIFPENQASVKLHKKAGFRIVGTREKLGQLEGVWRDVLLMERRSHKIGMD